MGLLRGLAEFPVDFMLVGVDQELVEQGVGPRQFDDGIGGQEGRETFLPVVVAAFDFAFGLRGGGVAELDAVEVEGRAELGEGVGVVGVEEGVVVHVEGQREPVALEGAREEVEVGEQGFGGIKACAGVEARGVIEDFQEDLFGGRAGQEGVGRGVVLPEGAAVAGLPAFDGLGCGFVAGVWGQLMRQGPAADAGAVGLKVEAAMEFAGNGAVGRRRFGGEQFGGEGNGLGGPVGMMIATGASGRPGFCPALSTGEQVIGAQLVEATQTDAEFERDRLWREQAGAGLGEEMTDQRCGPAAGELRMVFFMARRLAGRWIFRFGTDSGSRAGPTA